MLKDAAVGLAWFMGYLLVTKYVIKPIAVQANIPLIKDL
jgi:hypothetical protein